MVAPVDGVPRRPTPALRGATAEVEPAGPSAWERLGEELLTWFKTLASAAVYATLIVTFGCQVARVEGQSMAPTLEDEDRLIVNKVIYSLSVPQRGDIVMLWYPVDPDKSFVKRVIAEENDTVRIVDGKVYVNGEAARGRVRAAEYRGHEDWGSHDSQAGLLLRHGRPSEQQLRQPPLGRGAQASTSSARSSCAGGRCPRRAFSTERARRRLPPPAPKSPCAHGRFARSIERAAAFGVGLSRAHFSSSA